MSTTLPRESAPRLLVRLAALAALLPLFAACGDPMGSGSLSIEPEGRLERGQVVSLAVLRDGDTLSADRVTLAFDPADAVQALPGGELRLLRAGSVTVMASAPGLRGRRTLEVAAPPTIVFDLLQGGNRDIWKVALDGGDLTRLTTDPADDQDPTAAQNTVVFVSFRGGSADLWSVPLDGGTNTRLTTANSTELAPALRPDGQRLAYTSDVSGVARLWTANTDGSGAAAATAGFGFPGSIEAGPAWTATGNRLAFVTTSTGKADVYELTPPGTPTLLLGSANAAEVEPAWSPEGSLLAYTSDNTPTGDTEVFVLRVATGQVTRITDRPGTDSHPTWTRDGRLVYAETSGGVSRLRWVDPADPATVHAIDTGAGSAARPFALP